MSHCSVNLPLKLNIDTLKQNLSSSKYAYAVMSSNLLAFIHVHTDSKRFDWPNCNYWNLFVFVQEILWWSESPTASHKSSSSSSRINNSEKFPFLRDIYVFLWFTGCQTSNVPVLLDWKKVPIFERLKSKYKKIHFLCTLRIIL